MRQGFARGSRVWASQPQPRTARSRTAMFSPARRAAPAKIPLGSGLPGSSLVGWPYLNRYYALALRKARRFRFGPAVLDEQHAIRELAEAVDRDAHDVARLRRVRLGRNERRAGEKPRAHRQRVRRVQHGRELGGLARHVGDRRGPIEDRFSGALDGHVHLRSRDVDVPREHSGGADRAAAVVDLRLREEERIFALDASRAHVVPAREGDDLGVRVRQDGELGFGHVPRRVLAYADLGAVRNDAPPGGLEEEFRPVALVNMLVDRLLTRLLDARFATPQIRDPGGPDLLRFGRRGELDLRKIELGADDRAQTGAYSIER